MLVRIWSTSGASSLILFSLTCENDLFWYIYLGYCLASAELENLVLAISLIAHRHPIIFLEVVNSSLICALQDLLLGVVFISKSAEVYRSLAGFEEH